MFELTEENLRKHFGNDLMNFVRFISSWRDIGGGPTLEQFGKLGQDGREQIIEYLKEFSLYETVEVVGRTFVLTHAGLPDGATLDNLGEFDAYDFATAKIDYKKQYFDDAFLVTGHIPTMSIDRSSKGKVWRKNNHIAIDAGAAFGGALACVCLDTDEEFYVESR
jgi:serine/threonine protein phosphatase 1